METTKIHQVLAEVLKDEIEILGSAKTEEIISRNLEGKPNKIFKSKHGSNIDFGSIVTIVSTSVTIFVFLSDLRNRNRYSKIDKMIGDFNMKFPDQAITENKMKILFKTISEKIDELKIKENENKAE